MNNHTRKERISFNPYQTDLLQAYLEKMALEGWELQQVGKVCRFKKAESEKIQYAVVYFKYSHKTDEEEAAFLKENEEKGWKFIDHYNNIYVFKAAANHPNPIKFDKKELRKEIIGGYLLGNVLMMILVYLGVAVILSTLYLKWVLVSYGFLFLLPLTVLLVIIVILDLLNFIRWCIITGGRDSKALKKPPNLDKFEKVKLTTLGLLSVVLILCYATLKIFPSGSDIEKDQLPITLETVGVHPTEGSIRKTTYKKNATFLAAEEVYKDCLTDENGNILENQSIKYTIFKSDNRFFIDFYVYAHTHAFFTDSFAEAIRTNGEQKRYMKGREPL